MIHAIMLQIQAPIFLKQPTKNLWKEWLTNVFKQWNHIKRSHYIYCMNRIVSRELQLRLANKIYLPPAQSFIFDIFLVFCFGILSIHYLFIIITSPVYFPLIFLFFILLDSVTYLTRFFSTKLYCVSKHIICTEQLASICMIPK